MAHVQKRVRKGKDGKPVVSWRLRYRAANGKERSKTFDRKVDAERYGALIEADKARGQWLDPELAKKRYGDWVLEWIGPSSVDLKPKTVYGYEMIMRLRVLPTFADVPLGRITSLDVQAWIAEIVEDGYSSSTVRNTFNLFTKSMRAAVDAGFIGRNPCLGTALPKLGSAHEVWRILTPQEIESLAANVPERHRDRTRALILVLAYGGLRWGEAVALRRKHCDMLLGRLRIEESATLVGSKLVLGTPKSGRARAVSLPKFVLSALEEHLESHVDSSPDALAFRIALQRVPVDELRHETVRVAVLGSDSSRVSYRVLEDDDVALGRGRRGGLRTCARLSSLRYRIWYRVGLGRVPRHF
jgi:integrase